MNCDPIARFYRYFEYGRFGRTLERCRFAHLNTLASPHRVLILGEGDGRFLARLVAAHPSIAADVFDSSKRMLGLTKGRLAKLGKAPSGVIRLHQADARRVSFPRSDYDLAVTHFFFDVFSSAELETLVARIAASLAPQSQWLVSEFEVPQTPKARIAARFWLKAMYLFFRFSTGLKNQSLPDWRPQLTKAGFHRKSQVRLKRGFLVSEIWERAHAPQSPG